MLASFLTFKEMATAKRVSRAMNVGFKGLKFDTFFDTINIQKESFIKSFQPCFFGTYFPPDELSNIYMTQFQEKKDCYVQTGIAFHFKLGDLNAKEMLNIPQILLKQKEKGTRTGFSLVYSMCDSDRCKEMEATRPLLGSIELQIKDICNAFSRGPFCIQVVGECLDNGQFQITSTRCTAVDGNACGYDWPKRLMTKAEKYTGTFFGTEGWPNFFPLNPFEKGLKRIDATASSCP